MAYSLVSKHKTPMNSTKKRAEENKVPGASEAKRRKLPSQKATRTSQSVTIVTFDLETTDLIRGVVMPHITQIGAVDMGQTSKINQYVMPNEPISEDARRLTGITVTEDGSMTVHNRKVECVGVKKAMAGFCNWLEQFENVCLVAHNGTKFDFPILLHTLQQVDLKDRFFAHVRGLVDSLDIFREKFPGQSNSLGALTCRLLGTEDTDAHDAYGDAKCLAKLLKCIEVSENAIIAKCFSPEKKTCIDIEVSTIDCKIILFGFLSLENLRRMDYICIKILRTFLLLIKEIISFILK